MHGHGLIWHHRKKYAMWNDKIKQLNLVLGLPRSIPEIQTQKENDRKDKERKRAVNTRSCLSQYFLNFKSFSICFQIAVLILQLASYRWSQFLPCICFSEKHVKFHLWSFIYVCRYIFMHYIHKLGFVKRKTTAKPVIPPGLI